MNAGTKKSGTVWGILGMLVGALLLFAGTVAVMGYLGLPLLLGDDLLGPQLGTMAGIFLGLIGGGLAFYHGLKALRGSPSRRMKLPPAYFFAITFAVVLGLGNVLLNYQVAVGYVFPLLFLLGAALPTLGVLSWSGAKLGWPVSWRQGSTALVTGSTVSIVVTLLLGTILSAIFFFLIWPAEFIADSMSELLSLGGLGSFFFSPYVFVMLAVTALQAPIPEEFAKALGPAFMNHRLSHERQAFVVGLAAGAGFAILENMLYEGLYAQWSGWSWGGVTLLRAIGSVMHPICTGIIALALFRERAREAGWFGRVGKAYLIAVAIHTLWNGGFDTLLYVTGVDYYGGIGRSLDIYGESVAVLLVVYLVILSLGLWWLLRRIVLSLGQDVQPELAPEKISARALGALALVSVLVIVPIGALMGPAWATIRKVVDGG